MGLYFFIFQIFFISLSMAKSKELCNRIFFQNIKDSESPYKIVEGVYVKQSYTYNNFPVYKRENGNMLFYHQESKGNKYLLFGPSYKTYYGVVAYLYSFYNLQDWLSRGTLNPSNVFGEFINYWMFYDYRGQKPGYIEMRDDIKAVCVDKDFRQCDSERVYMNMSLTHSTTGAVVNDHTVDYFSKYISGGSVLYRNMRPVYKHSRQNWYLSYVTQYSQTGYWIVSNKIYPSSKEDQAWMRAQDDAARPEYITSSWFIHSSGWRENRNLKIRCRGAANGENQCPSSRCFNGAKCTFTPGNETVCLCSQGYRGRFCEKKPEQCSSPVFSDVAGSVHNLGVLPGDYASAFCAYGNPGFIYAVCKKGRYSSTWWKFNTCSRNIGRPTTRSWDWGGGHKKSQSKPINFDDYPAVLPAVLTTAVLVQFLLPIFLWLTGVCRTACKKVNEDQEDAVIRNQFTNELAGRLNSVTRATSREQLDQKVEKYRNTVRNYEKEKEERELKRKRGVFRQVSLFRLYSMQFYFSFFLWLIFLIGCSASECTKYGMIMVHLWRMSIAMCILAPLCVLIESACSHERDYLKNIMEDESAWDYIRRMHAVKPVINMTVECYHFETRTRVVTYTDANGNLQTRTETYQEKVTTFIDYDTFAHGSWVDTSKKEMPQLSSIALTRLKIEGTVEFGDQETADDFERQKAEMIERNLHRDVFQDFSSERVIPGLEKRISAYVDLRLRPYWMRERYYWLATLLFLTWPFRWYFRAKTAKNYYNIRKKLYKSTSPPAEVDIMDPFAVLQQCQSQTPVSIGNDSVIVNPDASAIEMTPYPTTHPPPPTQHPSAAMPNQTPFPPQAVYPPQGYPVNPDLPPQSSAPPMAAGQPLSVPYPPQYGIQAPAPYPPPISEEIRNSAPPPYSGK